MNPYDNSARRVNPDPYARFYKVEQVLEAAKILQKAPPLALQTDKRGTEHKWR